MTLESRIYLDLSARGLVADVERLSLDHFATLDEVMGRSRAEGIKRARHAVWRMLRGEPFGLSYHQIANLWRVDHTSVLHACRTEEEKRACSERHRAARESRIRAAACVAKTRPMRTANRRVG